jgi:hypothetical protein
MVVVRCGKSSRVRFWTASASLALYPAHAAERADPSRRPSVQKTDEDLQHLFTGGHS